MFRVLIAAGAAYSLGLPALDAYRPAAFDRPLQGFYFDVNSVANQCYTALGNIDSARIKYYFGKIAGRMETQLHR